MALRVLIAGGGTGGHIFPALAVARALVDGMAPRFSSSARRAASKRAWFRSRLSFAVGASRPAESSFNGHPAAHPARYSHEPACLPRIIRDFKPQVVLGIGGYASGPESPRRCDAGADHALRTQRDAGTHQSPGGKRVQAAAVNFPAAVRWFRNAEVIGIPVRPGSSPRSARSEGAAAPARLWRIAGCATFQPDHVENFAHLLHAVPGLTILHQCGARM